MDDDDDSDDLKQQRQQEEETAYEKYRLDGPEEQQQHQRHACGGAPNRAANWGRRGAAALDDSSMMTTMPPETSWSTHGQGMWGLSSKGNIRRGLLSISFGRVLGKRSQRQTEVSSPPRQSTWRANRRLSQSQTMARGGDTQRGE